MLRYQLFLSYIATLVAIWFGLLSAKSSWNLSSLQDALIRFAPLVALLLFGLYMLVRLVYGVLTFEDHPHAASALEKEVFEARAEMKERGIIKEE